MNPLSLITKGIQCLAGNIIVKKYYELPVELEIEHGDIDLEILKEHLIEITVLLE